MKIYPLIISCLLAGCASIATELPEIKAPDLAVEQAEQETLAFDQLESLRERLARVAAPILKDNVELCPKTKPSTGAFTHSVKTYPKPSRDAARREVGAGDDPSIAYIIANSPAETAGLKIGDIFLDGKNKPIHAGRKSLKKLLKTPAPILHIRRGGDIIDIAITPEEICAYTVFLIISSDINAYATGKSIIITSGMMAFVETDAELAMIIGHELAHNTMGHLRKIIGNIILSAGGTRYTRPFESEADYVGLYLMTRAKYDPAGVENVWRRLAQVNLKSVVRAKTHPTTPDRYLRIAATRAEIEHKQKTGAAIVPNFKGATPKELNRPDTEPS